MEITDAISLLIDSGFEVVPHHVEGWWKDTGKPEDVLGSNRLILHGIDFENLGKVEVASCVKLSDLRWNASMTRVARAISIII